MLITIFLISLILLIMFIVFKSWALEAGPYISCSYILSNGCREEWKKQHPFKVKLYMAGFDDETGFWGIAISTIALIITFVVSICIFISYSGVFVIDDKIAIYQEENMKIEERIDTIVAEYQDYEQETFNSLKMDGVDVIYAMYPELKSNDLVVSQMNLYVENNKKIKELRERKLDYRLMRWALIFF